jgi:Ni/Co efflux regulator RcnB
MSARIRTLPNVLAAALMASLPAASAWAQQMPPPRDRSQDRLLDRQADRQADRPPAREEMSDSVRRAERSNRGEVLSAERVQYDGRDMHRVKMVDDQGRVRVFMQDPARRNNDGREQTKSSNGD